MPYESLDELVSEKEFTGLFREQARNFLRINNFLRKTKDSSFTKKFYSYVIEEARNLETFLDDYNAKYNKKWAYMRALTASTRNMSMIAYTIRHVLDRLPNYKVREDEQFEVDSNETLDFFKGRLIDLSDESVKEIRRLLGGSMIVRSLNKGDLVDRHKRKFLPHDIDEDDDDEVAGADEKAAAISTKYIEVANSLIELNLTKQYSKEKLIDIIPSKINDEVVNEFKDGLRPLVSKYDTYIDGTPLEKKDKRLSSLRGYITLPRHLIEMASFLTHFYERHEDEIRHKETKKRIAAIVDKGDILDRIVNYSLFYATRYAEEALPLASEIKKAYTLPSRCVVQNPLLGLHGRPASNLVNVANHHGTEVFINVNGEKFKITNSIMSVWLAAGEIGGGRDKKVVFEGDERTLEDIKILAEYEFGEGEENNNALWERLSYLKKLGENS